MSWSLKCVLCNVILKKDATRSTLDCKFHFALILCRYVRVMQDGLYDTELTVLTMKCLMERRAFGKFWVVTHDMTF